MILSTDSEIMRYMEIVCSTLLLEINKKFPEPNYSIYLTSRVKSSKSNIAKLEDYTKICPRYHNRKHNDIASYPKGLDNWQFIVYQSIHRNWRDAVPDSNEWRTE